MTPKRPARRLARFVIHCCRVLLFAGILVLLHWQHEKNIERMARRPSTELAVGDVEEIFPQAARTEPSSNRTGWEILDENGTSLGYAVQTSPDADHIVGFSGPTNVLLVFDDQETLQGAKVLESQDTDEHVQVVVEDETFFATLKSRSWDELAAGNVPVDAVSGATLTSLAIWESIVHRLGGEKRGSLRFPEPLKVEDVTPLFPNAQSLGERNGTYGLYEVIGENNQHLGQVLRTSPATDGLTGYQGPTDTLVGFDPKGRCLGFVVRDSYDNEPYVGYVREGEYFESLFEGKTLKQLENLDMDEAGIEGVSGATMTSFAVADGIKQAAEALQREQEASQETPETKSFELSARDWGTSLIVLAGLVIGLTNLRGKKWVRLPFQLLLIGYLGFLNGDLVSQALLVGWAEHGIPWRSATGLVFLTASAICVPIFTRQNIYCHQICPHGAAQQLLKNRLPWQPTLPKVFVRGLSAIPVILLGVVVAVPMLSLSFSLVDLEPFDAYVFRIAGTVPIVIFIVGLIASLFVPMAYCRFGCPTGALLGYLRFQGRSDRLTRRDAVAVGLLALALLLFAAA